MTRTEFLTKMMNLERAINELTNALNDELQERGDELAAKDIDLWYSAMNATRLANSMTAIKCAISAAHDIAYK